MRDFRGLLKLAYGMDPMENFISDPTPSSPVVFRQPSLGHPIDSDAHREAVTKAPASTFYPMAFGPAATALAVPSAPVWFPRAVLASRIASRGAAELGKTWWTSGANLIASAEPVDRVFGYGVQVLSRILPITSYLYKKYPTQAGVILNRIFGKTSNNNKTYPKR